MDLIFNEISITPKQENIHEANLLMDGFLDTIKKAKEYGLQNIRVRENFYQSALCPEYRILDWLSNESVKQTSKTFLMSVCKMPFIANEQEELEDNFILRTFHFENEYYSKIETEGLAIAFLSNSLGLSFNTHPTWHPTEIQIFEDESVHLTKNISMSASLNDVEGWIEDRVGPILISTNLLPKNKPISLRDDHGKDRLKILANKLVNSEYVVSIVNSLPFNPTETNFIKKIRENGLVEIVLTGTDEGFGLVVKTTGKTLTQTTKIAEILRERYS